MSITTKTTTNNNEAKDPAANWQPPTPVPNTQKNDRKKQPLTEAQKVAEKLPAGTLAEIGVHALLGGGRSFLLGYGCRAGFLLVLKLSNVLRGRCV
jgi:hypothetical protein